MQRTMTTPLSPSGLKTDLTFDPHTLADDLCAVQRIYAAFFAGLSDADWERPAPKGPQEWNVHQTVAHLCALTGAGLESIQATLRGEPYEFVGLPDRYHFSDFNNRGIDDHLPLPAKALQAELLGILETASNIARTARPDQLALTAAMPIYNRPLTIVEALSIIMFHAGLHHSAQVAEPAGVPPLWQQLSPDIRHRVIGRVMRALSLLYRADLGGGLRAVYAFHVDGAGGGDWHVRVGPEASTSDEGAVDHPSLTLRLREPAVFCQMFTGRFNLPLALLTGRLKLRGNLRLFLRMGALFSVEARQG